MAKLILFNKPYDVLCQFTAEDGRRTLADYLNTAECKGCYPAGRLDRDSEGLLLLTDSGPLQQQIAHPNFKLAKTYWVQVEGIPDDDALNALRRGVLLKDGTTRPALVQPIPNPDLPPRVPPVRTRAAIPTQWLELTISEGRNRQVRRMTAAVGHPTLRLVRIQIGNWRLADLAPGTYRVETVHARTSSQKRRRAAHQSRHPRR